MNAQVYNAKSYQYKLRYKYDAVADSLLHREYIEETYQYKTESGSVFCKIYKRIKTYIEIIYASNVTNSLASVVNPSYYQPLIIY